MKACSGLLSLDAFGQGFKLLPDYIPSFQSKLHQHWFNLFFRKDLKKSHPKIKKNINNKPKKPSKEKKPKPLSVIGPLCPLLAFLSCFLLTIEALRDLNQFRMPALHCYVTQLLCLCQVEKLIPISNFPLHNFINILTFDFLREE